VREPELVLLQTIFRVVKLVDRNVTKDEELLTGNQTNLVWGKWSVSQIDTLPDGSRQQKNQLVVACLKDK
jgi:hypothetical protein